MASSANVLKAELRGALPARRKDRNGEDRSLVCCPAPAALAAVGEPVPGIDLNQAEVSILGPEPTVAHAVVSMLQEHGFSARAFASEGELMAQAAPAVGGCLVVDATGQDLSAHDLQAGFIARQWPVPVIFLTAPGDMKSAVRLMKAGAINCLPKPVEREELIAAVREALAESRAVSAQRAAQLRVRQMLERLTPREREVLDLALDGLLVKQIAARLGTAEKTIKTHKGRLMRKMEVRSTLALVQLMITTGVPLRPSASEPPRGI